jgi:hypothetical protein
MLEQQVVPIGQGASRDTSEERTQHGAESQCHQQHACAPRLRLQIESGGWQSHLLSKQTRGEKLALRQVLKQVKSLLVLTNLNYLQKSQNYQQQVA